MERAQSVPKDPSQWSAPVTSSSDEPRGETKAFRYSTGVDYRPGKVVQERNPLKDAGGGPSCSHLKNYLNDMKITTGAGGVRTSRGNVIGGGGASETLQRMNDKKHKLPTDIRAQSCEPAPTRHELRHFDDELVNQSHEPMPPRHELRHFDGALVRRGRAEEAKCVPQSPGNKEEKLFNKKRTVDQSPDTRPGQYNIIHHQETGSSLSRSQCRMQKLQMADAQMLGINQHMKNERTEQNAHFKHFQTRGTGGALLFSGEGGSPGAE